MPTSLPRRSELGQPGSQNANDLEVGQAVTMQWLQRAQAAQMEQRLEAQPQKGACQIQRKATRGGHAGKLCLHRKTGDTTCYKLNMFPLIRPISF